MVGGKYLNFVAKGKLPDAVVNTWKQIWERDNQLNRKYSIDFKIYEPNSQDTEHSEVDIYIAVK